MRITYTGIYLHIHRRRPHPPGVDLLRSLCQRGYHACKVSPSSDSRGSGMSNRAPQPFVEVVVDSSMDPELRKRDRFLLVEHPNLLRISSYQSRISCGFTANVEIEAVVVGAKIAT